jgi:5-(hydroxymethyl)furfural/furfural oxidase
MNPFDYVILGGGSAGCVLANRLSARPGVRVALVEAGMDTPPGRVPADIRDPYPSSYANPNYRWPLTGHATNAADSRAAPLLQARVMGGGSSIMGMIMLRGLPADYDHWAQAGAEGWSWRDVLPYFRALENDLDFGADALHGTSGPTPIRRHSRASWPPLAKAAGVVASRTGADFIADMNGQFDDGYGALPIAGFSDQRASSATAYLTEEVRSRPNLIILSQAMAEDLIFEDGQVRGARVRTRQGDVTLRARETILAMGALLTPAFLLKAGVGDGEALGALGVQVRHHRPGVGRNLQNHAALLVLAHLRRPGVQPRPQRNHNNTLFRYSSEVAGCDRSDMALAMGSRTSWHAIARRVAHFSPLIMSPASRGEVGLQLRDGRLEPSIRFNLLGDERDEHRLIDGLGRILALVTRPEIARLIGRATPASRLARSTAFARPTFGNRLKTGALAGLMDWLPGLGDAMVGSFGVPDQGLAQLVADPQLARAFVRASVMPLGHHAGACRMGRRDDPLAVVDCDGRVIGLGGLRIADASVMPTVPRGNTNLPVLMVAEKLAAAMLADRR